MNYPSDSQEFQMMLGSMLDDWEVELMTRDQNDSTTM